MSIQRTDLLHRQRKKRPLAMTRGLLDFLGSFKEIIESFEFTEATKAHIIGLSACMGNLKTEDSGLGLFSNSFIELSERIAKRITQLTKKDPPLAMERVVAWWLQLSIITTVGLLELARGKRPSKEAEDMDLDFRDELVLTLLFYTGYPKILFEKMACALEIEGSKKDLFLRAFELFVTLFALVSYSREGTIKQEFGEALEKKLRENIGFLKNFEEEGIKADLELAEIALEKRDIEAFASKLQDILTKAGYTKELFINDISSIKNLFKRLKTAYYATLDNKMNMIHMVG